MAMIVRLFLATAFMLVAVYVGLAFVDGIIGFGGMSTLYEWSEPSRIVYITFVDLGASLPNGGILFVLVELGLAILTVLSMPTGDTYRDSAWVRRVLSIAIVLATIAMVVAVVGAYAEGMGRMPPEVSSAVLAHIPLNGAMGSGVYELLVSWGSNPTTLNVLALIGVAVLTLFFGFVMAYGVYPRAPRMISADML